MFTFAPPSAQRVASGCAGCPARGVHAGLAGGQAQPDEHLRQPDGGRRPRRRQGTPSACGHRLGDPGHPARSRGRSRRHRPRRTARAARPRSRPPRLPGRRRLHRRRPRPHARTEAQCASRPASSSRSSIGAIERASVVTTEYAPADQIATWARGFRDVERRARRASPAARPCRARRTRRAPRVGVEATCGQRGWPRRPSRRRRTASSRTPSRWPPTPNDGCESDDLGVRRGGGTGGRCRSRRSSSPTCWG